MLRTVFSMFTTAPRRRPSEGASPVPTRFRPRSVSSPTTQQTLVVPMSSATTYLERGNNLSWNVWKNGFATLYGGPGAPAIQVLAPRGERLSRADGGG